MTVFVRFRSDRLIQQQKIYIKIEKTINEKKFLNFRFEKNAFYLFTKILYII